MATTEHHATLARLRINRREEETTIASNRNNRTEPKGDAVRYVPNNPHPLATRKTEPVWEGKYDEYGNRREVDVAGCAMPMQKIETIDQPSSEAAAGQLDLFEKKTQRLDVSYHPKPASRYHLKTGHFDGVEIGAGRVSNRWEWRW